MRINRNTRRSARPVFRSVNSSRRRAMNRRTLNSGRNYGTYCTFRIIDFPSFEIDVDKDAAIDYMNTHTFADIPVVVDDIYEDHNTYRVHLTYDMDEETGFNAWVGKQNAESPIMDVDETTIYSLVYSVLKNWARIKFDKQYDNDVNSSRRRNSRRALNSARSLEILSFNELNEAQKDYVVKNVMNTFLGESIWEFFNDTMMEQYHYDVARLAREYESKIQEELGFEFNIMENRLYWQSNSQGPYPEWNLGDVFGDAVLLEGDIWFDGKGLDVDKAVYTSDASEDPQAQEDLNRTADYLAETLQGFINEVWSLINEVCQAYPDEDYIYEDLEANDFGDFMVISETEAKPVRV